MNALASAGDHERIVADFLNPEKKTDKRLPTSPQPFSARVTSARASIAQGGIA